MKQQKVTSLMWKQEYLEDNVEYTNEDVQTEANEEGILKKKNSLLLLL